MKLVQILGTGCSKCEKLKSHAEQAIQELGVAAEVVLFASLVVAGMPFLLLVGAAPNAIAYNSRQFTSGEFLKAGIPASILLMVLVALAAAVIWPLMGMPVLAR